MTAEQDSDTQEFYQLLLAEPERLNEQLGIWESARLPKLDDSFLCSVATPNGNKLIGILEIRRSLPGVGKLRITLEAEPYGVREPQAKKIADHNMRVYDSIEGDFQEKVRRTLGAEFLKSYHGMDISSYRSPGRCDLTIRRNRRLPIDIRIGELGISAIGFAKHLSFAIPGFEITPMSLDKLQSL